MAEHTELPWHYNWVKNSLRGPDGVEITFTTYHISRANIVFLLRAVNSHDDLLRELRWIANEGKPGGCAAACGDVARAAIKKATDKLTQS